VKKLGVTNLTASKFEKTVETSKPTLFLRFTIIRNPLPFFTLIGNPIVCTWIKNTFSCKWVLKCRLCGFGGRWNTNTSSLRLKNLNTGSNRYFASICNLTKQSEEFTAIVDGILYLVNQLCICMLCWTSSNNLSPTNTKDQSSLHCTYSNRQLKGLTSDSSKLFCELITTSTLWI